MDGKTNGSCGKKDTLQALPVDLKRFFFVGGGEGVNVNWPLIHTQEFKRDRGSLLTTIFKTQTKYFKTISF